MWSSTGRSPAALGLIAGLCAAALAGCKQAPDVTIHLELASTTSSLSLMITDNLGGSPQDLNEIIAGDGTGERAPEIGIYLTNRDASAMIITFLQSGPAACHRLTVPLTELPLEFDLHLPADSATPPTPNNCDGCTVGDCGL